MADLERIMNMIGSVEMAEESIGKQYDLMTNTDQCRGYLESAQSKLTQVLEDLEQSYKYAGGNNEH